MSTVQDKVVNPGSATRHGLCTGAVQPRARTVPTAAFLLTRTKQHGCRRHSAICPLLRRHWRRRWARCEASTPGKAPSPACVFVHIASDVNGGSYATLPPATRPSTPYPPSALPLSAALQSRGTHRSHNLPQSQQGYNDRTTKGSPSARGGEITTNPLGSGKAAVRLVRTPRQTPQGLGMPCGCAGKAHE